MSNWSTSAPIVDSQSRDRRDRRRHAGRQHARVRRVARSRDRRVAVEVVYDAGPRRAGDRDVAESRGVAEELGRAVAAADLRSGAQPVVRADRPGDADLQRQEPRRGESLHLLDRRAQCRHRQDGVVLPDIAARHPRLGRDRGDASWSTARSTAGRASCSPRRTATATSSCSIAPTARAWWSSRSRCPIRTSASTTASLVPNPAKEGTPGGTLVFPTSDGAVNFPAQSFSPDTGLFYTNATDAGSIFYLSARSHRSDRPRARAGVARRAVRVAADGARLPHRRGRSGSTSTR